MHKISLIFLLFLSNYTIAQRAYDEVFFGKEEIGEWLSPERSEVIRDEHKRLIRQNVVNKTAQGNIEGIQYDPFRLIIKGSARPDLVPFESLFTELGRQIIKARKNKQEWILRQLIGYGFPEGEIFLLNHAFGQDFETFFRNELRFANVNNHHRPNIHVMATKWTQSALSHFSMDGQRALALLTLNQILPGYRKISMLPMTTVENHEQMTSKVFDPVTETLAAVSIFNTWYSNNMDIEAFADISCDTNKKEVMVSANTRLTIPDYISGNPFKLDFSGVVLEEIFSFQVKTGVQPPNSAMKESQQVFGFLNELIQVPYSRYSVNVAPGTYIAEARYGVQATQDISGSATFDIGAIGGFAGAKFSVSLPTYNWPLITEDYQDGNCSIVPTGVKAGGGLDGGNIDGDLCNGVICPPDHTCENGNCMPGGGCVIPCSTGFSCQYGVCVQVSTTWCFPDIDPNCDDNIAFKRKTNRYDGQGITLKNGKTLFFDIDPNGTLDGPCELLIGIYNDQGPMMDPLQSLAQFDQPQYGGNGDGQITKDDLIWAKLFAWDDKNGDGQSTYEELAHLNRGTINSLHF